MRELYLLIRVLLLGPFYAVIVALTIRGVRKRFQGQHPEIQRTMNYGANYIDPGATVIMYVLGEDNDFVKARANGLERDIVAVTKHLLARYGFPRRALEEIHIVLVSQEAIDAAGGDWNFIK